jgi:biopolymer transport protein ExbB
MKMKSVHQFVIMITIILSPLTLAQSSTPASTLDELLQRVRAGINADAIENKKLLEEFEQRRDQQQQKLAEVKTSVAASEALSLSLRDTINNNELNLNALNDQLKNALGNFGELFGVTRQVAADTRAQVANSLISAQYPHRDKALDSIATSKVLPTIEQLRYLWVVLLQEQMEQGRIARFQASVDNHTGISRTQEVLRLGPFTAISDEQFVTYKNASQQLALLGRQPPLEFRHSARVLNTAAPGDLVKATLDPSSGAILELFIDMPSHWERFQQGGLPGYVVTVLACFGLAIGLQRLLVLLLVTKKVNRQVNSKNISSNNPLGRVLQVYDDNPKADVETLELKLNDAILKETPALERGLNTIKVLAAVAPLLGLLGTVIGMINTFQAITLWGAGDPKLMADGISQALVTTVQGLLAAIPLLLLHSVTSGRAKLVQQVLEEQSAGLIARRAEAQPVNIKG